jgi:hypothetical protein
LRRRDADCRGNSGCWTAWVAVDDAGYKVTIDADPGLVNSKNQLAAAATDVLGIAGTKPFAPGFLAGFHTRYNPAAYASVQQRTGRITNGATFFAHELGHMLYNIDVSHGLTAYSDGANDAYANMWEDMALGAMGFRANASHLH